MILDNFVTIPTFSPIGAETGNVCAGMLESRIEWSVEALRIGGFWHDEITAQTFGSAYDGGDQFRFSIVDGKMNSCTLIVPSRNLLALAISDAWLALPRTAGLVQLPMSHGFHVDVLELQHFVTDGSAFVAARAGITEPMPGDLRLAIHPHVDLLFQRGVYCGWVVLTPLQHQTPPLPPAEMAEHAALLTTYFELAVEPMLDRMFDKDPDVYQQLINLRRRALQCQTPPALLIQYVTSFLQDYYKEPDPS